MPADRILNQGREFVARFLDVIFAQNGDTGLNGFLDPLGRDGLAHRHQADGFHIAATGFGCPVNAFLYLFQTLFQFQIPGNNRLADNLSISLKTNCDFWLSSGKPKKLKIQKNPVNPV